MKTKEKIKKEVLNYLEKTLNHTFVKSNGDLYKVLIYGDNLLLISGNKISVYNIDDYVNSYMSNTKCVLKHIMFLIPSYSFPSGNTNKIKSVRTTKDIKEKFNKIKNLIEDKKEKIEIIKIIESELNF